MSTFALASVKASPGVTTLCQALALSWPEDRAVVVVEADPAALGPIAGFRQIATR